MGTLVPIRHVDPENHGVTEGMYMRCKRCVTSRSKRCFVWREIKIYPLSTQLNGHGACLHTNHYPYNNEEWPSQDNKELTALL